MRTNTAVILAAGRGSRLDPDFHEGTAGAGGNIEYSKPLLRLGDQTLLQRTVGCCRRAGIDNIVVVTGFRADGVEADIKRYNDDGAICTVYNSDWKLKNGVSVLASRERVTGDFALMMADHLFDHTILTDLSALELKPGTAVLAIDRKIDEVFDLDDATKVQLEGPVGPMRQSPGPRIGAIGKQLTQYNAIDCGLFVCTPEVFAALEQARVDGDCSLSDGMATLARSGGFLAFDIGPRRWQDVDTPEMFEQALRLLEDIAP